MVQTTLLYTSSYLPLITQKTSNRISEIACQLPRSSSIRNYLLWGLVKDGQNTACGFDLRSNSRAFSANGTKSDWKIMKIHPTTPGKRLLASINTKTMSKSFIPFLCSVRYLAHYRTGRNLKFVFFLNVFGYSYRGHVKHGANETLKGAFKSLLNY